MKNNVNESRFAGIFLFKNPAGRNETSAARSDTRSSGKITEGVNPVGNFIAMKSAMQCDRCNMG